MMKWHWALVAALVSTTGCDALREAFRADEEHAAVAASARLPAERLGQLLGAAPQVPVSPETARILANLWVDYMLVALASADGNALDDSATVAAAAWAPIRQRIVDSLHSRLLDDRVARIDSVFVDSVYQQGDLRFLEHILVAAGEDLAPDQRAAKRGTIDGLRRRIDAGASFAALAAEHSEDGSRERQGRLGLFDRGETVRPFEDAGWSLAPGEVSGVVETQFGYHLIRRPPLAEVREPFEQGVAQRLSERFDSIYLDSLGHAYDVRVSRGAPVQVRDALSRREELARSGRTLVRYRGGKLTVGEFVYWITGFPPRTRNELVGAPDSMVEIFLEQLVRSEILVDQAREAGIGLTPEAWTEIRNTYLSQLGFLRSTIGIEPNRLADSAATVAERRRLAQVKVEAYLRDLLADRRSLIEPPTYLAFALRERFGGAVRGEGLQTAYMRAQEVRATLPGQPPQATPSPTGGNPPPEPSQPGR